MKRIIIITLLIILIPFIIVNVFVSKDNIKFLYVKNAKVIRVKDEQSGNIITMPFEDYIVGVLAGEMPASFNIEALKAQAVAARSYALRKMISGVGEDYDVVNTINNQVYLTDQQIKQKYNNKYSEYIKKIKKAVLDTKGEYLSYHGEIVEALFFSTSTGYTENCEEVFREEKPYLKSVESKWDSEVSPVYDIVTNMPLDEFYKKLNLEYNDNLKLEVTKTTSTGRVKEIKINGKVFTGSDVYKKLLLKSTYFSIVQKDKTVSIETKGYGHGVGMSQYGAQAMALKKYNYNEILKYYYTGVEIKKM